MLRSIGFGFNWCAGSAAAAWARCGGLGMNSCLEMIPAGRLQCRCRLQTLGSCREQGPGAGRAAGGTEVTLVTFQQQTPDTRAESRLPPTTCVYLSVLLCALDTKKDLSPYLHHPIVEGHGP